MRGFTLIIAAICSLTSYSLGQGSASQPEYRGPAGFYVTTTPDGDSVLALNLANQFRATIIPSQYAVQCTMTGRTNVPITQSGVIRMPWFNGRKVTRGDCTYAIIDGQLWLGVFCKPAFYPDHGQWACIGLDAGIYGSGTRDIPNGLIEWDTDKGVWYFQSVGKPAITNVRMLAQPGRKLVDGEPFVLVFDDNETWEKAMPAPTGHDNKWSSRMQGGFRRTIVGLAVPPGWTLEEEAKGLKMTPMRFFDWAARTPIGPIDGSYRRLYRRRGDVILAPWSTCLGPAGHRPTPTTFKDVEGEWVDAKDPKQVVRVVRPPADRFLAGMMFGRPEPGKPLVADALHFEPDADGVSHQTFGYNCGMNHADIPGHIFWFHDGRRIVRYITPSTHGPYPGGCQVFERRQAASQPVEGHDR